VATLALGLGLSLAAAEALLRLAGRRPWSTTALHPNEPTMMQPDPIVGWRSKPGQYVYPGYTKGAPSIQVTIWPDGARATRRRADDRPHRILLVGDSFTQGWAVSDDETWAWKLQDRWPSADVRNHGTAAYGTYQSLLLLRELLARRGEPPRVVIYGFAEQHEDRNVADLDWLRMLALHSHRGTIRLPFCGLRPDGTLEEHAPEGYPAWPLSPASAAVTALQDVYAQWRTGGRRARRRRVTEALLSRMSRAAAERGSRLLVVLLWSSPAGVAHYGGYLAGEGIGVADCTRSPTPRLIVPGEGHPNREWHRLLAGCVAEAMAEDRG
jgi:hypothetical protein